MASLTLHIRDISEYIHPLDDYFPVCPVCQNELRTFDLLKLVTASGSIGLAHKDCVDDINDYLDRKDNSHA